MSGLAEQLQTLKTDASSLSDEQLRTILLTVFVKFKRQIREVLALLNQCFDMKQYHSRVKRKLEAQNNIFNHHRIVEKQKVLDRIECHIDELRLILAKSGDALPDICSAADHLLSLHDKAQLLSVSHIKLERYQNEWLKKERPEKKAISLFEWIFTHNIEYQRKRDFIPLYPAEAPLWSAALASMYRKMRDPAYRKVTEKIFGDIFSKMPHFRVAKTVWSDGSVTYKRLLPKRVIKNAEGYRDDA